MQKVLIILLMTCLSTYVSAQRQKKISTYGSIEYVNTLYDRTTGNNPWGVGVGVQTFLNNKTKFKPTIELTEDVYLEDDKLSRLAPGNIPIDGIGNVLNVFVGSAYAPTDELYVSFLAGPSFINGRTLLGIKPSLGLYLTENKRLGIKASYINIFHREPFSKQDFGSWSVAIQIKLF